MNKNIDDKQVNPKDFSLGVGGPLYRSFEMIKLLHKPLVLYKRRMIVIALFAWLPLFVIALFSGVAFNGVYIPFIHDVDVHIRFLIVLPLLIYAEVIAHDRLYLIVDQFLKTNVISMENRAAFNRIIASSMRFRDSVFAEMIMIILVYTLGHWILKSYLPLEISSWFAITNNGITKFTPAGIWYVYISLPIFQFLLLRWYFRIIVWYRFLWQISRLPLHLNSLHPDRAGGLGFLSNSIYALEAFLITHSILLTGMIFNRIWNAGALVSDFKLEIISISIFVLLIPLIPLLFFMTQLARERRIGTLNYDIVANRYVNDFRQKWIPPFAKSSGSILGSPDIQSLSDLANSFSVSDEMRIVPFNRSSLLSLIAVIVLPLLPLIFTFIPIDRVIRQIFGLFF